MPYLSIQSNKVFSEDEQTQLIKSASSLISTLLGKPETYVMVAITPPVPMLFAGKEDLAAYLELKSIGLPEEKTQAFSKELCALIETQTGIDKARIYIEFSNAPRAMWGWNGATF
jgi:phenylpyruvate tautomerase PptA (4-oxalocrotonate tautomerase family)